jgi:hypothetical protein
LLEQLVAAQCIVLGAVDGRAVHICYFLVRADQEREDHREAQDKHKHRAQRGGGGIQVAGPLSLALTS